MDAQLPKPARVSCLEEHRELIALSRRRKCSYRTIAAFLLEQHSLKISHRAIREFCRRRGIVKGKGETEIEESPSPQPRLPKRQRRTTPRSQSADDTSFDFDESLPLETWKTRTGARPE